MIIVAGKIHVDAADRAAYLATCVDLIEHARRSPGCIDFHLSADPVEPGRINIYEQWDDIVAVETFRGSGPSPEQQATIRDAAVFQHEVSATQRL